MSSALTLTEAGDALAPRFIEDGNAVADMPSARKGNDLTVDDGASLIAERLGGEPVDRSKKKPGITIKQASSKIGDPALEVAKAIPALRSKREDLSVNMQVAAGEYQDFVAAAQSAFAGVDESALANSPEWFSANAHAGQLQTNLVSMEQEAQRAWIAECETENAAFLARHPELDQEGQGKIRDFLLEQGISEEELRQMWLTPEPIDVSNPICTAILQRLAGSQKEADIIDLLHEVGFDDDEIVSVGNGTVGIHLHDHRIQELVWRAANAH